MNFDFRCREEKSDDDEKIAQEWGRCLEGRTCEYCSVFRLGL